MLVGATGTIGTAVWAALEDAGHDVVPVSHSGEGLTADLADKASLERLYERAGALDAVVCTAGVAKFGPLEALADSDFRTSIENKLMGQVNLLRLGASKVRKPGSFTLTTGTLAQAPEAGTSAVSMASGALESFARAAAIDLEGRYRVNVVSPTSVAESLEAMGRDPGGGIRVADLAPYYVRAVDGHETGRVWIADAPMPAPE